MSSTSRVDVDRLLAALREEFGETLGSRGEYTPRSRAIHYLRDGIDRTTAGGRLVRIEELYQAQRLMLSVVPS